MPENTLTSKRRVKQNNLILEGIHYSSRKVIRLGIGNGLIYSLTEVR